MANSSEDPKPDGKAFDDFFESIGKKAENLTINDPATTTNGDAAKEDDDQRVVDEIESLCMNCHEDGTTRLLLTRIPYFKEIILMSFSCPHCHFKNSEIQSAGEIQQKGSRYELRLTAPADFARQIVKSDTCVVKFIELDLEVPAGRGQLTNVEGLLTMILEDLEVGQEQRKTDAPEVFAKIDEIITKGKKMVAGEAFPFRLVLDDPAGNSWIEPDQTDGVGKLLRNEYPRTKEQNEALSLSAEDPNGAAAGPVTPEDEDIIPDQVYSFPASCPGCMRPCTTHMKMVEIPHFKQVVIMSTVCEDCGYRSNEVKTGGEVPEKGKKITLKVSTQEDLARDILKAESCSLECPELRLSVNPGTLGGRFTTVEGLLTQVRDDLHAQIFDVDDTPENGGDSLTPEAKNTWSSFFEGLNAAIKGDREFTIVLTDPLASSYVQNLCSPEKDPKITEEDYERTAEEEEELGLTDMKTEGYEEDAKAEKKDEKDEKEVEKSAES